MRRSFVRRGAGWLTAVTAVVLTGCGGDSTGPAPNSGDGGNGGGTGGGSVTPVVTTSVTVGPGNVFSPADIQVSPGATVRWTFAGPGHNVTFAGIGISSGDVGSGFAFDAPMPTTPGTYTYACTNHPGMNGTVKVQ